MKYQADLRYDLIQINKPILGSEERRAVLEVLKTERLTDASPEGGPKVREFEESLENYLGSKHVVALNSGTAALYASLLALDVKKGDEVLLPSFTFVATANAVLMTGASPIFVDVSKTDFTLDIKDLRAKVGRRTKVVVPVHLYGYPSRMHEISEICRNRGIAIIEDAAQSLGATYKGRQTGSIGNLGCLSFYGSKIITCGEGGAVVTNDDALAGRIRVMRTQGVVGEKGSRLFGFNMRMPEISAAIGVAQMGKLTTFLAGRRRNATTLRSLISDIHGISLPHEDKDRLGNWYVFTITVSSKRDQIAEFLNKKGIRATVYYKVPVHRSEFYSSMGYQKVQLPKTDWAAQHALSLPVHPSVTPNQLESIASHVEKAVSDLNLKAQS